MSYTLAVPSVKDGVGFYGDAGLEAKLEANVARLRCPDQDRPSIVLIGGAERKRLSHVTLRATDLEGIAEAVPRAGGKIVPPMALEEGGLWVSDPHGLLYHLVERSADPEPLPAPAFEINAPGRIARAGRSALKPIGHYRPVRPRRLGHVLLFTPNVLSSVSFLTEALGMGLTDRAQDIIAFCCARQDSDHHVVAFAKSPDIGFHHGSFLVSDPDEVGRSGRALVAKAGRGDWGFGRHTIGSNFFHYIQDPWGSWFEYYSDMDYIENYALWTPTIYGMEDSLANWGPQVPPDFVHNYEADELPYGAQ
jgi:catechol 2,3-dioxygenase